MSDDNKTETTKENPKKQTEKPTYWERVIHGKGTVAEPWPTAEELWDNAKDEIDRVQKVLNSDKKEESN